MPKYQPTRLTDAFVRELPFAGKDPIRGRILSCSVRDTDVKGLMVVVHQASKVYALQRDVYSRERDSAGRRIPLGTRRVNLGDAKLMMPDEARRRARKVIEEMDAGQDPREARKPTPPPPKELTFGTALAAYVQRCRVKARADSAIDGYEAITGRYLKDWTGRPLRVIGEDLDGVEQRHLDITKDHGPVCANHTMRLLRAVYRHARKKQRDLPPPPTEVIDFNAERKRTEVITGWPKWWARVHELRHPVVRDWWLFLAFSGMRKTSAFEARVEHLDLATGFLHVLKPKGGSARAFDLPLSGFLRDLLGKRVAENREVFGAGCPWLFPSRTSASGHLSHVDAEGLPSPHVCRHSYATAAKAVGLDDIDVALLLNHKLARVTARYVHGTALGGRLIECQQRITDHLLPRCKGETTTVVPFRATAA